MQKRQETLENFSSFQRIKKKPKSGGILEKCATSDIEASLVRLKGAAQPRISKFQVAAAIYGSEGKCYPGVNVEFNGVGLEATIHAEEFAVLAARSQLESKAEWIAVSAAPCGYCRQLLNEFAPSISVRVVGQPPQPLQSLLPHSFGPTDLGIGPQTLTSTTPLPPIEPLPLDVPKDIADSALSALASCYCPYTKAFSAAVLRTRSGALFVGSHIENAAFNPSIPPWKVPALPSRSSPQGAVVALMRAGEVVEDVVEAILVETAGSVSHEASFRGVVVGFAKDAAVRVLRVAVLGNNGLPPA